jgi:hypothetical protein
MNCMTPLVLRAQIALRDRVIRYTGALIEAAAADRDVNRGNVAMAFTRMAAAANSLGDLSLQTQCLQLSAVWDPVWPRATG